MSTGAAGLALMTGAPLLPVFATRANRGKVRIEIGAPIAVPIDGTRDEKLRLVAQEFADRTEPYIRRCPSEWRGWRNLKETGVRQVSGRRSQSSISLSGRQTTR